MGNSRTMCAVAYRYRRTSQPTVHGSAIYTLPTVWNDAEVRHFRPTFVNSDSLCTKPKSGCSTSSFRHGGEFPSSSFDLLENKKISRFHAYTIVRSCYAPPIYACGTTGGSPRSTTTVVTWRLSKPTNRSLGHSGFENGTSLYSRRLNSRCTPTMFFFFSH